MEAQIGHNTIAGEKELHHLKGVFVLIPNLLFRGTSALVVVILFAAIAGYCWYKSRKQAREGYSRPSSTRRDGEPMGGGFLGLFAKGKRSNRPKLRLDDQDDTNEL